MRQYQQVWENIKSSPKLMCQISAHRAYHLRIIKAVKKEKNMDLAYKLECSERDIPCYAVLASYRAGPIVTFTITFKPLYYKDSLHKQLGFG
jgi:hypothetical protein